VGIWISREWHWGIVDQRANNIKEDYLHLGFQDALYREGKSFAI